MLFDGQGRCLTINESGRSAMGCLREGFIGESFLDLWPESVQPVAGDALRRVLAGGRVSFDAPQNAAGEDRWWSVSLSPLFDDSGAVDRFISIGTDITTRRESEERTRRHLENMKALVTVGLAVTGSIDLDATLATLLDQVTTRLQLDAASVLLLDEHTLTLRPAASRGFRTGRIDTISLRLGHGYGGLAALERRRIVIRDLRAPALPPALPGPLGGELSQSLLVESEGFRAYLNVPLLAKGKVVGVLEVFSRSPLDPDEETLAFLDALGGQAAVALENAQLFAEVGRSRDELRLAYDSTIEGWARALDYRDRETEGHSRRVTELTERIAAQLGFAGEDLLHVRWGALLHDIGKLGVPDGILLKEGPLSEAETAVMRRHSDIAYEILSPIAFLQPALHIPYCHHEWWDGSGYPRGLRGEQIPLAARIFAIVDVWDALSSDRPYRPAWPRQRILGHLRQRAGTHFDPGLVELFLKTVGATAAGVGAQSAEAAVGPAG